MNKRIDFGQFEDEFGNLKEEFEVICYFKNSDGEWVEDRRTESGRNHYKIDDQIYYRTGDNTLIKLNMDFNSKTCGACYQIGNKIENKRKITSNEMLFNYGDRFLYKQSYSNNASFYTLQDYRGNWKLGYGSNNLSEIIAQLKQELKSYLELNLKQLADKHSKMINDMEGLLINS